MTLEGAIKFHETDSYVVYTMNSATTGQYCVILPKQVNGVMNMLVDLHMKGLFDSISAGTKTREQLIDELGKEYVNVKEKYVNAMLVFPMIDEGMLQSAVVNNDKQKMFDEVKKIGAITSEIYKKLTNSGVEKQNIDQKIIIVEKNEEDDRFVAWLKEQMPNFVDGIRYSELEPEVVVDNPFMSSGNDSIFGAPVNNVVPSVNDTSVVSSPVVSGDIFGNSVSSTSVESTTSSPVVSETNSVSSGMDVFGGQNNGVGVVPVAESVVSTPEVTPVVEANNGVAPVSNSVASAPSVSPSVEPMGSNIAPSAPAPQPVNSVDLEGTTTFSPIPNADVVSSTSENATDEMVEEKGSKGFVNLVILLVVLIGVTIASIELGKFLYSVYGA